LGELRGGRGFRGRRAGRGGFGASLGRGRRGALLLLPAAARAPYFGGRSARKDFETLERIPSEEVGVECGVVLERIGAEEFGFGGGASGAGEDVGGVVRMRERCSRGGGLEKEREKEDQKGRKRDGGRR
jgi:hypothetical protein